MKNLFFLILGLILILGSIFLFFGREGNLTTKNRILKINDTSIKVEIADTPEMRVQGLSGRKTLREDAGMLFIFDSPARYGFWMKDMNFAIDIVWIDENRYVIGVEKNVLPETFPQIFSPDKAVKYVLELPAEYTEVHNIDTGAMVQF